MNTNNTIDSLKLKRNFLPEGLKIDIWADIETYYNQLLEKKNSTVSDLKNWLADWSELDAVVSENYAWRYIKMTCDTGNKELLDSFTFFTEQIEPKIAPIINKLQKKIIRISVHWGN